MPTYGQINSSNVLIGISRLSGAVNAPHMILITGGDPVIGSTWTGSAWTAPPTPEPAPLPPLTRRQLRLGLLSIGITAEDVEAEINAIVDPTERAYGMIEWQDATQFRRDHPLIAQVAVALALPPEQVDDLWVWALGL